MSGAAEAALLDLLDEGEYGTGPERAALLARAAGGEDPGSLPVGGRDRLVLRLHARLFGPVVEGVHTCPRCAEPAEFTLAVEDLDALGPPTAEPVHVEVGGYTVTCRLITGADLVDAARAPDSAEARCRLLLATVVRAHAADRQVGALDLPADVVAEVAARLAEADPLAEVRLDLRCATCAMVWDAVLDPVHLVWSRLRDWSRRLMWEIHVLAEAYGWREADVLALPAARRAVYLGLVLDG